MVMVCPMRILRMFNTSSRIQCWQRGFSQLQSVSLEEQQSAILNGLPPEFDHMVSIITTSKIPFNLQGITMVLLDAEARQEGHLSQNLFLASLVVASMLEKRVWKM
ncbi:hypothetical protein PVK06_043413 [Gossypium arboreum]|uniref:Uncharacterized protein n=1 Tax=Gossypium arboreum TaxID=29729 RepID=A0ABR0MNU0_GOSAR|nr:hypothetical protein PVK06_043413 [Gossypium arboreum]